RRGPLLVPPVRAVLGCGARLLVRRLRGRAALVLLEARRRPGRGARAGRLPRSARRVRLARRDRAARRRDDRARGHGGRLLPALPPARRAARRLRLVPRERRTRDRSRRPDRRQAWQDRAPVSPDPDELRLLDAYWRAANYLSVGQIYLLDNPLLREP